MKEFKSYTYVRDKNGKWINKPIDSYNHAIDAIRYYVIMELMTRQAQGITKSKVFYD